MTGRSGPLWALPDGTVSATTLVSQAPDLRLKRELDECLAPAAKRSHNLTRAVAEV